GDKQRVLHKARIQIKGTTTFVICHHPEQGYVTVLSDIVVRIDLRIETASFARHAFSFRGKFASLSQEENVFAVAIYPSSPRNYLALITYLHGQGPGVETQNRNLPLTPGRGIDPGARLICITSFATSGLLN